MPYSSDEHVDAIRGWLNDYAPQHHPLAQQIKVRFLDVGAGAGWNLDRYADALPVSGSVWTALEVWTPYLERFNLFGRYHAVLNVDVRTCPELEPAQHVILLGDVLEHLEKDEALCVWDWARQQTGPHGRVVLTLPIVHWPQGAEEGNPHEEHLHHWDSDEVLSDLQGIYDHRLGTDTGAFIARGYDE